MASLALIAPSVRSGAHMDTHFQQLCAWVTLPSTHYPTVGSKRCVAMFIRPLLADKQLNKGQKLTFIPVPPFASFDFSSPFATALRELTVNQPYTGSVPIWNWDYLYVSVPTGNTNTLLIQMDQTDDIAEADCDIFVKHGSIPSHTDYDWRDVSLGGHITHNITNAVAGRYYIGVFAFRQCHYRIRASLGAACPNNCNNHGLCNSMGQCECTGEYTGADCSARMPTLALNSPSSGTVLQRAWSYLRINLPYTYSALTVTLTQADQSANTDLDLYVRRGAIPTQLQFDYANGSMHYSSSVSLVDAAAGDWYVGVWGYKCATATGCRFTVTAAVTDRCPNRCSMRGFCRGTVCSCQPGYTGDYCEAQTAALTLGSTYHGYVENFAWNYYTFRSSTANPIRINVAPGQIATGDCDLFVRKNERPTIFRYDYKDTSLSSNATLDIASPGDHTWHVGLYGFRRCDYSLQLTTITDAGNCQHGGTPVTGGTCLCPAGYGGNLCEVTVHPLALPNTAGVAGSVRSGEFVYYNVSLPDTPSDFVVYVKETKENSQGEIWVYLNQQFIPTIREHAFSDIDTNTRYHMIHVTRQQLPQRKVGAQNFIIGIYGSPYIVGATTTSSYRLTAWASPFH